MACQASDQLAKKYFQNHMLGETLKNLRITLVFLCAQGPSLLRGQNPMQGHFVEPDTHSCAVKTLWRQKQGDNPCQRPTEKTKPGCRRLSAAKNHHDDDERFKPPTILHSHWSNVWHAESTGQRQHHLAQMPRQTPWPNTPEHRFPHIEGWQGNPNKSGVEGLRPSSIVF